MNEWMRALFGPITTTTRQRPARVYVRTPAQEVRAERSGHLLLVTPSGNAPRGHTIGARMQVTVTGTNLDLSERVKEEAIAKLSKVRTIFDRFIDMDIVFTEDHNPRIEDKIHCEVVLHAKGRYLRAEAAAPDPITAIDRAEAKLARQVRKLKTKVMDHKRTGAGVR